MIQIDSVNVLVRTHYLPAFSRLGPYPQDLLEREAWGRKPSLFEYWGHEASLLPVDTQPLFRWRMEQARSGVGTWSGVAHFGRERRDYIEAVLARDRAARPGHRRRLRGRDAAQVRRVVGAGATASGRWNGCSGPA